MEEFQYVGSHCPRVPNRKLQGHFETTIESEYLVFDAYI